MSGPFSQGLLYTAFDQIFAGMDENCLVIIYYAGHGDYKQPVNGIGQLFLHEHHAPSNSPSTVNFTHVRNQIINCQKAKVLVLLHCCYAARGSDTKHEENIAACSEDRETPAEDRGFTYHLVEGTPQ
jgi:hypothetical protein